MKWYYWGIVERADARSARTDENKRKSWKQYHLLFVPAVHKQNEILSTSLFVYVILLEDFFPLDFIFYSITCEYIRINVECKQAFFMFFLRHFEQR